MSKNQTVTYSRFWVFRYSLEEDLGYQMQQATQDYIKRFETMPFLVLVPEGMTLLSPMSNFEIQRNELVPPYRFYFALEGGEAN
jgi:hypothetical protein